MKLRLLTIIAIATMLISCEQKEQKAAEQLMMEAHELIALENYPEALLLLDSLQKSYPKIVKVRKDAFQLAKDVRVLQGRSDSLKIAPLLADAEAQADLLYKDFKLIEVPDMPDENVLRYKGYDPSINSSSPFLDCYITDDGQFKLVAGISATYPIKSFYIKVYSPNSGSFEVSDTIPYDGGRNYRYEYLSRYYERLTFSPRAAERVAAYISDAAPHDQLVVRFYKEDESEGPTFTLNSLAKKAIIETYTYYTLLQRMVIMDNALQQHEKRLQLRQQ